MRFLHPGHNEVSIEARLSSPSDRQCDASIASTAPRLVLSDTSELVIPRYTYFATSPQLPGALAKLAAPRDSVPVYLHSADEATVGSALDLLANLASQGYPVLRSVAHLGAIQEGALPGIVVSPLAALPAGLSKSLQAEVTSGGAHSSPNVGMPRSRRASPVEMRRSV